MAEQGCTGFVEDAGAYRAVDPEGVYTRLLSPFGPMMGTSEVAAFLGVSRQRVGEMCRTGEIPDVPRAGSGRRHVWIVPKLCLIKYLVCAQGGRAEEEKGRDDG